MSNVRSNVRSHVKSQPMSQLGSTSIHSARAVPLTPLPSNSTLLLKTPTTLNTSLALISMVTDIKAATSSLSMSPLSPAANPSSSSTILPTKPLFSRISTPTKSSLLLKAKTALLKPCSQITAAIPSHNPAPRPMSPLNSITTTTPFSSSHGRTLPPKLNSSPTPLLTPS